MTARREAPRRAPRAARAPRVRAIAVTNQKGGTGKTTTAVNLAAALGEQGRRVLLVDLDPQGSASAWLGAAAGASGAAGGAPRPGAPELRAVFTDGAALADVAQPTAVPGVTIVPATAALGGVERVLAGEVGAETILAGALAQLPADAWDVVLVDCPPALGLLAVSALVACRELVVPVEARAMALAGLASLMQTVDRVRARLNPALTIAGILACRVDVRTNLSRDVVDRLRERFGPLVFSTVVRENVRLAEAPSYAQPVTLYAPTSAGAEDYRAVAAELWARTPSAAPAPAAARA